jgi:hypothetical protein
VSVDYGSHLTPAERQSAINKSAELLRFDMGGSREYCRAIAERVIFADPAELNQSDRWARDTIFKNMRTLTEFMSEVKGR